MTELTIIYLLDAVKIKNHEKMAGCSIITGMFTDTSLCWL